MEFKLSLPTECKQLAGQHSAPPIQKGFCTMSLCSLHFTDKKPKLKYEQSNITIEGILCSSIEEFRSTQVFKGDQIYYYLTMGCL